MTGLTFEHCICEYTYHLFSLCTCVCVCVYVCVTRRESGIFSATCCYYGFASINNMYLRVCVLLCVVCMLCVRGVYVYVCVFTVYIVVFFLHYWCDEDITLCSHCHSNELTISQAPE